MKLESIILDYENGILSLMELYHYLMLHASIYELRRAKEWVPTDAAPRMFVWTSEELGQGHLDSVRLEKVQSFRDGLTAAVS
jgi:hypothetical protein